jgi:hypothetical protein
MTREHFEIISGILAHFNVSFGPDEAVDFPTLVDFFAKQLSHTNKLFDEGKFKEACGV